MIYKRCAALVLIVGGLSAGPGSAAAQGHRPSPFRIDNPRYYAGLVASSGSLRYLCDLCSGSRPGSSLTITGNFGLQFVEGSVLAGVEGTFQTGQRERFTLIAASVTGLALHRRLMLGAGFGFAGYHFKTIHVPWSQPIVAEGGWQSTWGFGGEVHAGLRLPVGHGLAITPQASYSASFGNIVQFAFPLNTGMLVTGHSDFAVLALGVGVLWSQR